MVFAMATMGAANMKDYVNLELAEIFGEYDLTSSEMITVIVENKEPSVIEAKHTGRKQTKANVVSANKKIIKDIENKITDAEIDREYNHVFAGFSVELPQNQIKQLLSIQGIKAIYPDVHYQTTQIGEGISWEAFSPNMLDSAPFIGSDDAWDAGFTGKGVTVAIIDTGVDYTHPDLAHAFGDYKGWDFVDNDNDPQETPVGDPRGASTNHGSHVAGTVAANGLIKGVAPDATLLAYRVLGPGGRGSTANVIAGIERGVQDGAHVMNLSLGADVNDPDYATSIALDWAMAEGVVAVTSNGNSGPINWTVGSPGTSREAISVGATALPYNIYNAAIFTSDELVYTSPEVMGFPNDDALLTLNDKELEYVYVGLGGLGDFEDKDVKGKVALIERGEYAFVDKSDNAKAHGAIATIIYNSADGQIEHFVAGISLPTIKISGIDGKKMLNELEAGNNTVSFDIQFAQKVGETMADFSSRGPVMGTWMIKPDVSAPGVAIVSTVPNGYASMQGTSMSAPHVAGAAALILQAHPNWSVDFVKAALMNTAEDIIDPATGKSYPHNSQGAGSIRVLDAINAEIIATPGSHSFGVFYKDSGKEVRRQSFTVHNLSDQRVRYSIEFSGHDGIKVQTSNNLQVQAGKTQELNFGVQVDNNLPAGYYEGTFLLSDGTQTIKVPTILFVGEPDYPEPLLLGHIFANNGNGTYTVGSQIPQGADRLDYDVALYNNGSVGPLLGTFARFYNVPGTTHQFIWNGSGLPSGQYAMFIYVEKDGRSEYLGWVIDIE